MKYCNKCGKELEDTALFCSGCGTKQETVEENIPVEQPEVETATNNESNTEISVENYQGKTCPYCKTEINEGDCIKVCPSCNIPHHEGCWAENKGCTTFGCSEQHYEEQGTNPTNVCANCGHPIGDEQAFCPKCGQKMQPVIEANVSDAISQFNQQINQKQTNKKKSPLIIGLIAAVVIIIVAVIYNVNKTAAIEEYKETAQLFYDITLSSGADLEDVGNEIGTYWRKYIYTSGYRVYYNGHYMYDIDDAVGYALSDNSATVSSIKSDYLKIQDYYSTLKDIPYSDDELEDIHAEINKVYNAYAEMYECVIEVSGNYTEYSSNFSTCDTNLAEALEDLHNEL